MNDNQSAWLLGGTIVAFIIWIIVKGELPTYIGFFTVAQSTENASETGSTTTVIGSTTIGGTPSASGNIFGGSSDIPSGSYIPGAGGITESNPLTSGDGLLNGLQ